MQGEHPVQLKKNKMLTSAKLLHFGGFHNCTLLLTPAALGQPGGPTPGKVPGSLSTAGGSDGPVEGYLSWGIQKVTMTQPAPSSNSRKQEKAAFENQSCLFPLQLSPIPNPATPGTGGRAGAAPSHEWEQELPPEH